MFLFEILDKSEKHWIQALTEVSIPQRSLLFELIWLTDWFYTEEKLDQEVFATVEMVENGM